MTPMKGPLEVFRSLLSYLHILPRPRLGIGSRAINSTQLELLRRQNAVVESLRAKGMIDQDTFELLTKESWARPEHYENFDHYPEGT